MQRRHPSSALAPTNRSSIRRRSGAYPNQNHPGSNSPNTCTSPGVQEISRLDVTTEVGGKDYDKPTIRPVSSSAPSPLLPVLPGLTSGPKNRQTAADETDEPTLLSYIPLTPRPDAPSRTESSNTSESTISRLPTPDFTAPRQNDHPSRIRSFLSRGLSFVSLPAVPFLTNTARSLTMTSNKRPYTLRSDSDTSEDSTAGSESSRGTNVSVDSGRYSLIPSIGTTEKFTHKWPKPRSLQYSDNSHDTYSASGAATELEEGKSLGMNKVERWSVHKWCLMLSVITVFVYGAAGLACAILTWFKSEWHYSERIDTMTYLYPASLESSRRNVRC